jgi:hypothetical protein
VTGDRRLRWLLAAGLIDSFGLALGWTAFLLAAVATQGLQATALYAAAMLGGVALSAPVTERLAGWLDGRRLLQLTGLWEGYLRIASFVLLLIGAPLGVTAAAVAGANLLAWCGFAAMRAEVAAVAGDRARALTWYAAGIGAIEALGAAVAALLPVGSNGAPEGVLLVVVVASYGLSLVPTLVVARGARVRRRAGPREAVVAEHAPALGGALLVTALAAAPALLGVALAAELYGRAWVAPAALAFGVGALAAPAVVGRASERAPLVVWPALGALLVGGWIFAASSPVGLLVAQWVAGLALSALDGLFDARVARGEDDTAALGWAASARSLGGAVGVAAFPALIAASSLPRVSAVCACVLALAAGVGWLALTRLPLRRRELHLAVRPVD